MKTPHNSNFSTQYFITLFTLAVVCLLGIFFIYQSVSDVNAAPYKPETSSMLYLLEVLKTTSWRTMIIAIHLTGLVLGFGAAIFLDMYLLSYLAHKRVEEHTHSIAEFGSRLVSIGLVLLWVSGLSFLALYAVETPEKLANPKIWAKMSIVVILTFNGFIIHKFILSMLTQKIGKTILEGESGFKQNLILLVGTVSFNSWAFAMLLGISRELNNMIGAPTLLLAFLLAVTIIFCVVMLLKTIVLRSQRGKKLSGSTRVSPVFDI